MGAVVLEIFQGKHYGSIFGAIMLAALAGGAAGPWVTGLLHDLTGELHGGVCDRNCGERCCPPIAIWQAAPGKIRAVAGRLHRLQGATS